MKLLVGEPAEDLAEVREEGPEPLPVRGAFGRDHEEAALAFPEREGQDVPEVPGVPLVTAEPVPLLQE